MFTDDVERILVSKAEGREDLWGWGRGLEADGDASERGGGGDEADMEGEMSIFAAERNADGVTNLGDTPAARTMDTTHTHVQFTCTLQSCIYLTYKLRWVKMKMNLKTT